VVAGQHGGDVVRAASLERQVYERLALPLGRLIGAGAQYGGNPVVFH
jgi:hypothetical protein